MRKRIIAALLALLCVAIFLALPVAAATEEKWPSVEAIGTQESTLKLNYKDGETALSGTQFYLYKVGTYESGPTRSGAYNFTATTSFIDAGVSLNGLKIEYAPAGNLAEMARKLVEYILTEEKTEEKTEYIVENGTLTFSNLEPGLYLVRGEEKEISDTTYTPQAFLIPLPYPISTGVFKTEVEAKVKYAKSGSGELGDLEVHVEIGNNDPDLEKSFTITVYKNDVEAYSGNGAFRAVTSDDGKVSFGEARLKGGSTWGVSLPPGNYIVVESEYDDYTVTADRDQGDGLEENIGTEGEDEVAVQVEIKANSTSYVKFLNTKGEEGEEEYPQPSDPQPSAPQPSSPQPSSPQPSDSQPGSPQPSDSQPGSPQPSDPRPGVSQPSGPRPSAPQPNDPRPSSPQPSYPQPDYPLPPNPPVIPDEPSVFVESPSVPGEPGLPQTGQSWRPVLVLMLVGVPLLVVGAVLVFRKKKP